MKPGDRIQSILEQIELEGDVSIFDLAAKLDVSEMTIRRDLDRLERSGAIRRAHGRAMKGNSGSYEPPFAFRTERQMLEKALIAKAISSLIQDRETVILDGGSTGAAIAKELVERELTVCTPSLKVADVLRRGNGIQLMVTGGMMRRGEESLVGPSAIATLSEHRFDTYIMTVSGIDPVQGCTEWNTEDAIVKRAALRVSTRCIVAADHTKFGASAFARVCDLEAVSRVVTDSGLSSLSIEKVRMLGVPVHVAA